MSNEPKTSMLVTLPDRAWAALDELARKHGISQSQAMIDNPVLTRETVPVSNRLIEDGPATGRESNKE